MKWKFKQSSAAIVYAIKSIIFCSINWVPQTNLKLLYSFTNGSSLKIRWEKKMIFDSLSTKKEIDFYSPTIDSNFVKNHFEQKFREKKIKQKFEKEEF